MTRQSSPYIVWGTALLTLSLQLSACGVAGSFDPTTAGAAAISQNKAGDDLLGNIGTTFLIVGTSLALAAVARLLNHRRKE